LQGFTKQDHRLDQLKGFQFRKVFSLIENLILANPAAAVKLEKLKLKINDYSKVGGDQQKMSEYLKAFDSLKELMSKTHINELKVFIQVMFDSKNINNLEHTMGEFYKKHAASNSPLMKLFDEENKIKSKLFNENIFTDAIDEHEMNSVLEYYLTVNEGFEYVAASIKNNVENLQPGAIEKVEAEIILLNKEIVAAEAIPMKLALMDKKEKLLQKINVIKDRQAWSDIKKAEIVRSGALVDAADIKADKIMSIFSVVAKIDKGSLKSTAESFQEILFAPSEDKEAVLAQLAVCMQHAKAMLDSKGDPEALKISLMLLLSKIDPSLTQEDVGLLYEMSLLATSPMNAIVEDKTSNELYGLIEGAETISELSARMISFESRHPVLDIAKGLNSQLRDLEKWDDVVVREYANKTHQQEIDETKIKEASQVVLGAQSLADNYNADLLKILQYQCLYAFKKFTFNATSKTGNPNEGTVKDLYKDIIKDVMNAGSFHGAVAAIQGYLTSQFDKSNKIFGKELMSNNSFDTFLTQTLFNKGQPKGLFHLKPDDYSNVANQYYIPASFKTMTNIDNLKNNLLDHFTLNGEIQGDISLYIRQEVADGPRFEKREDRVAIRDMMVTNLTNIQEAMQTYAIEVHTMFDNEHILAKIKANKQGPAAESSPKPTMATLPSSTSIMSQSFARLPAAIDLKAVAKAESKDSEEYASANSSAASSGTTSPDPIATTSEDDDEELKIKVRITAAKPAPEVTFPGMSELPTRQRR